MSASTASSRPTASIVDPTATQRLLEVRDLSVELTGPIGPIEVVQHLDFTVTRGQVHAVVGESGSGKSVTALSIMGLLPPRISRITSGSIRLDGTELTTLSQAEMRAIQGQRMAMIFQEPMSSLNPAYTIGDQIGESMRYHLGLSRREANRRSVDLLQEVGIPNASARLGAYPHEFSGGMRQRVMIAIALACNPDLLIADEPTTALDVTIQAQIMELLRDLSAEHDTAIIFITHDFGVVAEIADEVTVMYSAQAIETGDVYSLFEQPRHPYTEALLHAVPSLEDDPDSTIRELPGSPPNPLAIPPGCRFAPRCAHAIDACTEALPPMLDLGEGRATRCIRTADIELVGRQ